MKRIAILLALTAVCLTMWGQGRLSASTRLAARRLAASPSSRQPVQADDVVRAFISVDRTADLAQLRRLGVRVQARFSGVLTATLPLKALPLVCRTAGVRQVSVAQVTQECNDSARLYTRVDPLALGEGFTIPFDGTGVIVGVIDSGVDFNHINLCDSQGRSRVVAAYLPQDTTGVAPVVDGDTLPGSHYDTPQQIARLTTDDNTKSHGTHTAGTAAGAYHANGLQGVAPGASLVICAMPALYDTDIANSVKYIFDYADRVGMPAVINMSFASNDGPHDGTSPLCRIFDELSGPGRLLSVSAHNSGFSALHLSRKFKSATDTLSTTIGLYSGSFSNLLSCWSSPGHHHRLAVTLIDRTDKKLILETPYFTDLAPDSVFTFDTDADPLWSQYVSGVMEFATAVEEGDRSHSILFTEAKPHDTSRYRIGIKVVSPDADPKFNAWVSGGGLFQAVLAGQTAGTKAGTINDLATGDCPISVGAYVSKQSFFQLSSGQSVNSPRATPLGGIAYFTAWGPDLRGRARPDICAPGMVTVSSASRYDSVSTIVNTSNLSLIETVDGVDYPYGACYGTSMSAPVMTGTLALWLQAVPNLSPDDVREVLDNTAVHDEFVLAGDARQWGRGKLDAQAGMRYLLAKRGLSADVNGDGQVDVADINAVINVILDQDKTHSARADVNGDGQVDVADINAIINRILTTPND